MKSHNAARVVMIGLDAGEPSVIEKGTQEGWLPNLRKLRDRGSFGRLGSTAKWLTGSPWPTFFMGVNPSEHGFYNMQLWRSDQMAQIGVRPDWMPLVPFWRELSQQGPRVAAVDVPMCYTPEAFNGIEVSGWATHDQIERPASYPRELIRWVHREYGRSPLTHTADNSKQAGQGTDMRGRMIRSIQRSSDLAEELMRRQRWDLFLWCISGTHRGGHQLWGFPKSREEGEQGGSAAECSQALKDVYIAADAAVGRILDVAGDKTTFLVFSVHGMGVNNSRAEIVLPKMLSRVLSDSRGPQKGSGQGSRLDQLRRRIPVKWRAKVGNLLPKSWQTRLTTYWRLGKIDWSKRRAFCLYADATGYIRINLRGREKAGIVDPGEEYDRLCAKIAEGLSSFVDADTGRPVIELIERADRIFSDGPRRDDLPDLLVVWTESSAAEHKALSSPRYGSIPWPTPGAVPDGRSGNHRAEGFLIASGDQIRTDVTIKDAHILDLVPTLYALFGVKAPSKLNGRALPIIQATVHVGRGSAVEG